MNYYRLIYIFISWKTAHLKICFTLYKHSNHVCAFVCSAHMQAGPFPYIKSNHINFKFI